MDEVGEVAASGGLACFDLDNTLIDRQRGYRSWAEAFAEDHGLGADAVELLTELDDDGFASREQVFGPARQRLGLSESVEELIARYRQDYPRHVLPAPESAAALERLRARGWRVAIVTNGPASQRIKVARAGLGSCFDALCISEELGVGKPGRAIFEAAARRCGVELDRVAAEGWMVGDSPSADIAGGRAAGMRTIWIARGRPWTAPLPAPDLVVEAVPEAVEALLGERS